MRTDAKRQSAGQEPRNIRDVLAELMARKGYARIRSVEECEQAWQNTVGAELGQHSQTGNLRRGVLEIRARNSTVLQELSFQKRDLLQRLQQTRGDLGITDLKFRVGVIHDHQKD